MSKFNPHNWRKKPYNEHFSDVIYRNFKVFKSFRPLAHDVHKQLFVKLPNISHNQIRAFLFYHCRLEKYHNNVIKRGYRKNLDFSRGEKLTVADKTYHKQRLHKINGGKVKCLN